MTGHLRRREFITLLGGAVAWPLTAWAQQPNLPVVGFISGGTSETDAFRVNAFREGLNEAGYMEGRNVKFDYRWADGHYERLPSLAADLVAHRVNLIAATFTQAALAAKTASATIPIVFTVGADPVKVGLVSSFNRPGGNVTGVSVLFNQIVKKQVELLRETSPTVGSIAFLVNPANANAAFDMQDAREAALALGRRMIIVKASSDSEIEAGLNTLVEQQAGALLIAADVFLTSRADRLVDFSARHKLPMLGSRREWATAGALISYGGNIEEGYHWAGVYAGRILKGEKPADLPVQQSVKLGLVINLKTAKTLGLEVPQTLLARADEVIE